MERMELSEHSMVFVENNWSISFEIREPISIGKYVRRETDTSYEAKRALYLEDAAV